VARQISQRQLRNDSGEIMRDLDRGEAFIVTRNGTPVGELRPFHRRRFVPAGVALAAFQGVGRMDRERFRADLDRFVDQDPTARAHP
jgi:antitoxin (DNA-binding transcriptional repressor) of toxin-antitoxin stability system